MLFLISSNAVFATENRTFSVSPFLFVEGVDNYFYMEGTLTAHIVAARGIEFAYRPNSENEFTVIYGDGSFNASNVDISTKVYGIKYEHHLAQAIDWPLFFRYRYMRRSVYAERSTIHSSGRSLTDTLDSRFKTLDAMVGIELPFLKYFTFEVAHGLSKWNMDSDVVDQFIAGSFRVTTYRQVDNVGTHPLSELSIKAEGNSWDVYSHLSTRSLGSKSNKNVLGVQLGATIFF